jgi:hypothetical protein
MQMDREHVTALIKRQTDMTVQTGPFAGMRLSDDISWGDGDLAPKLLGTYEQELHAFIAHIAPRRYGAIVDIGCAEGYYAVGAARLFPGTKIYAFDTDQRALHVLNENLRLNGVAGEVEAGGTCTAETLLYLAEKHGSLLVICDCEGYEISLFARADTQSALQQALRHSDLIIECHDFLNPLCSALCLATFAATHLVENVYSGGRNPNAFPFLSGLSDFWRWMAVYERRPCLMNWLLCQSRQARAGQIGKTEVLF